MSKVSILLAAAISLATGAYAVTVDLSSVTADTVLADGDVATGTLGGNYKISAAAGATVTLSNVTITNIVGGSSSSCAGLTCFGDAEIVLEGENVVKGRNESSAGIYVPEDCTLTISGSGSLTATGGRFYGAGIGGGFSQVCGYIVIDGGVITATGGAFGAGIGSGGSNSAMSSTVSSCQDITINGGRVTATGGAGSAGIGGGYDSDCSNIEITGGTVIATGGAGAAGIGGGNGYSNGGYCDGIWITGGLVTATGGENAAGIGTGENGYCNADIYIGPDISRVIATCGENCTNPIGAGVGDEYSDDPRVDDSLISTLSADGRTLTIVPDSYVEPPFTTGGDADWTDEGDGVWKSGAISDSQTTWAEVSVSGPCLVSFSWKTSSESGYDKLHCYLDGAENIAAISGEMSTWDIVSFVVRGSGSHTVKFAYTKDYGEFEGDDCGWVKDFTVTSLTACTVTLDANGGTLDGNTVEAAEGYSVGTLPMPTWSGAGTFIFTGWFTAASGGTQVTAETVVNGNTTLYAHWMVFQPPTYTTGGDANWTLQTDGSWKSGAITSNQNTWIEFSVTGPCAISFSWKTSSENYYDELYCYSDGEEALPAISGVMSDWSDEAFPILESGGHTVRFTFTNDVSTVDGQNCGWVKDFTATPLVPRPMTLNAQGGTLSGNTISVFDGYAVGALPVPAWNGAGLKLFVGWFTSAEGGTRVTSETIADAGLTVLYAHWDTSVSLFETGGDAFWTDEGGGVWRSGAITNRESTWVKIYVTAPCDVNFSWKTSSEKFDKLHCYLDGAESLAPIGGEMSVWSNAAVRVQGSGAHEIMFTFTNDNFTVKGQNCAWVKGVTVTPLTPCTVTLDANGGTLDGNTIEAFEGYPVGELPMPTWSGEGSIIFTGWFTAASGGTQMTEETVVNGDTTFYAHWEEFTPPAFTTGGDADWTFLPDGSWRSGAITNNQSTWIEFPVTGPCEVAFSWKTSSESDDKLYCEVDGEAKLTPIGGEMSDWANNTFMLQGGNHIVKFTFTNDYYRVRGQNCAWVKGFTVTPLTPCTVTLDANGGTLSGNTIETFEGHPVGELPMPVRNGAIRYAFTGWFTSADGGAKVTAATVVNGNTTLYAHWEEYTPPSFTTGGDANWTLQTDGSWRSGEITHSQSNWIATAEFSGKGTISFNWKTSSEKYDKLTFYIDGVSKAYIGGQVDWSNRTFTVSSEGEHEFKWIYKKDSSDIGAIGSDCAWIDFVVWTPESAYDAWAAESGLTEAWNVLDANGNAYVFRYAFDNPTGDFTDPPLIDIAFDTSGKAVVKTPELVNSAGYTFSVVASDNPDGTGNVATYDLQASGETTINETGKTKRFFRLTVREK